MENKKKPKLVLLKKSGLIFNIGLLVSLMLVIFAFEYKSNGDGNPIPLDYGNSDFPEELLIPPTDIYLPPPKPKKIIEVVDEEKIIEDLLPEIDTELTEELQIPDVADVDIPPETPEEIFIVVEQMPTYPGGMRELYSFISKQMNYPSKARKMGVEGRVTISFVIDKDGSIINIKLLRGIGSGCDKEAIRVLSKMTKWNPGKQRGKPVKVRMTIPITFKLS